MAERKKLLLRLDPAVHEAMAKWAADDLRSVNAQIEYALRLALRSAGRAAGSAGSAGAAPGVGQLSDQHQQPGEEQP
ncbi:hypothetical protein O7623_14120 [Solwaraspora sp. WMMD791]|uniref:hypothetical protein n=1 Tax=Solwaraspora sp. WMMD791 TaxID=3016086 RepID=UPI00249C4895|nr:hypothetical protein [Solwaraspora sp. WMMD791]WFE30248.1 hypothetical protein O7623_14120 [Solwaraspora sp. WMMD791]